jgi:hypothetical protein
MSASVIDHSTRRLLAWLARRPSGRALLIAMLAIALALGSRGANAIALNGAPVPTGRAALAAPPRPADAAALQAEAARWLAQDGANPAALRTTGQAALVAGRNDATVATFLRLRWAPRLDAGLERYGAMLASSDVRHLALATAGIEHFGAQLHSALLLDGPSQLITVSIEGQHLVAYDRGRVLVDTPVTTGRPALPTDIGAMRVLHKDSPWTMQSPWPKRFAQLVPGYRGADGAVVHQERRRAARCQLAAGLGAGPRLPGWAVRQPRLHPPPAGGRQDALRLGADRNTGGCLSGRWIAGRAPDPPAVG